MTKPVVLAKDNINHFADLVPTASTKLQTVERGVAVVALFSLGLRQFVQVGFTSGYLIAILLIPVWIGSLRGYWGARFFFIAATGRRIIRPGWFHRWMSGLSNLSAGKALRTSAALWAPTRSSSSRRVSASISRVRRWKC